MIKEQYKTSTTNFIKVPITSILNAKVTIIPKRAPTVNSATTAINRCTSSICLILDKKINRIPAWSQYF